MHDKLFESALGISAPWAVKSVEFDAAIKRLTVLIDFTLGTRFGVPGHVGAHPVHDTVATDYRHLNFFQHECHLRVRTPRVKPPDGAVRLVKPEFAGRLAGFTLLRALLRRLHRWPTEIEPRRSKRVSPNTSRWRRSTQAEAGPAKVFMARSAWTSTAPRSPRSSWRYRKPCTTDPIQA